MTHTDSLQQSITSSIAQAMQVAIAYHQAGQLQKADELYRVILELQPKHPDVNHSLGILALQKQEIDHALSYFMTALDADPTQGVYWLSYIDALIQAKKINEAQEILTLARQQGLQGNEVDALSIRLTDGVQRLGQINKEEIEKEPFPATACAQPLDKKNKHNNTVNSNTSTSRQSATKKPRDKEIKKLAELFAKQRYSEAESTAKAMTERYPLDGFGWKALGAIYRQTGRNADALPCMHKAAELSPNDAETHSNLADTLQDIGEFESATASYRLALQLKPNWAEVHCRLAYNLKRLGRLTDAEASYLTALRIKPTYAIAHCNLGVILLELGRLKEAEASYLRAIDIAPTYADAHNNLGNLFGMSGRMNEAEIHFHRAIQISPDFVDAYSNLGNILRKASRLEEAEKCYRNALKIKPDYAAAHSNMGVILLELGRLSEAEACYRYALEIDPEYHEAHNNLGIILYETGRLDEAEASFHRALKISPENADVHNNLGNTFKAQGKLDAAEAYYRRAIDLKPSHAEANNNLGSVMRDAGRHSDAEVNFRRAIQIKPTYADAHNNYSVLLQDMGQIEDALTNCRKAIEFQYNFPNAHINMGNILHTIGQLDDAVKSYRQALKLNPQNYAAYNSLLFTLNYHPDKTAEDIYRVYQEYDSLFGIPLRSTWRPFTNDKSPNRRLRIGYVSPDFRKHSSNTFLEPLLAGHNKTQVEVYAYAELNKEDSLTARYKSYVEHWTRTTGMSDDALAERIRSDGIDILIDLAGHTTGNRLPVFTRKPAPVSISMMGFGYTTGLSAIDYFIMDEAAMPEGSEHLFAEQPWRIATPAFPYQPVTGMGETNTLPALSRGYVTFGTLTRSIRINHRTIRAWSALLKRVAGSRLVIDSGSFKDPVMQERLATRFAEHGITRDRLEIGYHTPPWDVLRGIDISLDCFPHNSGTTLIESLYMGIPFITLADRPSVGRIGSVVLKGVDHPEWIAHNEAEYVEKAVQLANNLEKLAQYRATLRGEIEAGEIFSKSSFVGKMEDAYRQMWQRWCEKK